jgi:hypothetical protein
MQNHIQKQCVHKIVITSIVSKSNKKGRKIVSSNIKNQFKF